MSSLRKAELLRQLRRLFAGRATQYFHRLFRDHSGPASDRPAHSCKCRRYAAALRSPSCSIASMSSSEGRAQPSAQVHQRLYRGLFRQYARSLTEMLAIRPDLPYLAQVLASVAYLAVMFTMSKLWVFRQRNRDDLSRRPPELRPGAGKFASGTISRKSGGKYSHCVKSCLLLRTLSPKWTRKSKKVWI